MDVTNNHKLYYTSDQNVLNISNLRQLSSYQKRNRPPLLYIGLKYLRRIFGELYIKQHAFTQFTNQK
ncbi:hypothetical protein YYC_04295 [Plasmodium yoelii 17X]|uniref:Uncharacterized protein n=1 Tax=Plasmodium yoelii 17X TaxID=1323249 RepID=V7PEF1_PLAYE|nr:hypothetical protein YYC_04295 [Plasmodium yoelii 17X]